jgi:hypothetical protein
MKSEIQPQTTFLLGLFRKRTSGAEAQFSVFAIDAGVKTPAYLKNRLVMARLKLRPFKAKSRSFALLRMTTISFLYR